MSIQDFPDDGVIVPDPGMGSAVSTGFSGIFGLFVVIAIGALVFSVVVGIRKYRVLKDAGVDPLTVDAAMAAKVINSDVLAPRAPSPPPRTIEDRLRELDDLLARGVITPDEHRAARAAALAG